MKKCWLVFFFLAAAHASAETLAEAVARFEKMGMPNVAAAEFVKIIPHYDDEKHIVEISASGNAWLLSEETMPDGRRVGNFIINGGERIRVAWSEWREEPSIEMHGADIRGTWEKARLKRAIGQVMQFPSGYEKELNRRLTEHEAELRLWKKNLDEEEKEDYEQYIKRELVELKKREETYFSLIVIKISGYLDFYCEKFSTGHLYLFALQLHQQGETEAAEAFALELNRVFGAKKVEASALAALKKAHENTAYWKQLVGVRKLQNRLLLDHPATTKNNTPKIWNVFQMDVTPLLQQARHKRVPELEEMFETTNFDDNYWLPRELARHAMTSILDWKFDDVLNDTAAANTDRAGKMMETFVFQELAAQVDLDDEYSLYHYRDREKREIDFVVERADGALLGVEVKAGRSVSKADFAPQEWFKANIAKNGKSYVGLVLYSGEATLSFGNGMHAVPTAALWAENKT